MAVGSWPAMVHTVQLQAKRLLKLPAVRGVVWISAGTVGGQLIAFAIAPILTRLYSPEAFGVFAYVMAIALVLTPVAALRLELTIPLPTSKAEAGLLARLAGASAAVCCAVCALVIAFFGGALDDSSNLELMPWLWLLPPIVLFTSWYVVLSQLAITDRQYGAVATRNLLQGTATAGSQLLLSLVTRTGGGLLTGWLIGRIAGVLAMFVRYPRYVLVEKPFRGGADILRRYKRFPLVFTPAALLNALGTQLPLLLIGGLFGATQAGYLGVAQRIVEAPAALFSAAVSQVFVGELAERVRSGQRHNTTAYLRSSMLLGIFGLSLALGAILLGPIVFPWLLGQQWAQSGAYAQAIGVWVGVGFIVSPLSQVYSVYQRAGLNLALDIFRVAIVGGAGLISWLLSFTAIQTLWTMTAGMLVTYALTWLLGLHIVSSATGDPVDPQLASTTDTVTPDI